MNKRTGVWLDGKKAMIVTLTDAGPKLEVVESEVEYRKRFPGEGREFGRFGNSFIPNEEKEEERIRKERRHFLNVVMDNLDPANDIVITGPAQTRKELVKMLEDNHAFAVKPITVKPLDSMTENQFVAWVEDYFQQVVG